MINDNSFKAKENAVIQAFLIPRTIYSIKAKFLCFLPFYIISNIEATLFFWRDCAEIAVVPLGLMLLVGKYTWEKLKERKIEFNAHAAGSRGQITFERYYIVNVSRTQKWSNVSFDAPQKCM
jgi:hypothetical protein